MSFKFTNQSTTLLVSLHFSTFNFSRYWLLIFSSNCFLIFSILLLHGLMSGYKTQLEYKIPSTSINRNSKNRKRKIVWFNRPYNQSVSTNVAQTFLKLIDKHFPCSNRLHKIFNRNTIKVSYSCTDNTEQHVKKKIITTYNTKARVTYNLFAIVVTN